MEFSYEARTQYGEIQSGIIDSSDEKSAIDFLQRHNFIIVSIRPVLKQSLPALAKISHFFVGGIKKKDLAIFSRQMAILIEAKVPLVSSLRSIVEQSENKMFKEVIHNIASNIEAGMSFSGALSRYPEFFSSFYINLVKSGEAAGDIEGTLIYLADHLEKEYELEQKIKGAFVYPAFITAVFIIVGIIFITVIVPKITVIFAGSGQELPLVTRLLIGASDIFRYYWWLMLALFFAAAYGVKYYLTYYEGYKELDRVKLKIPIIGNLFKKIYITRFAENLSTLVAGGVSAIKALNITAEVIGNEEYKKMINKAAKLVKTGESMSSVFSQQRNLMPPMVVNMISIGEKTGKLDLVLKKIAVFYQRETENSVANLSSLIEPLIILVLGLAAAILVAAILLPIYNFAGGMQ
jgi:type IV pilus assembly protein PilC